MKVMQMQMATKRMIEAVHSISFRGFARRFLVQSNDSQSLCGGILRLTNVPASMSMGVFANLAVGKFLHTSPKLSRVSLYYFDVCTIYNCMKAQFQNICLYTSSVPASTRPSQHHFFACVLCVSLCKVEAKRS